MAHFEWAMDLLHVKFASVPNMPASHLYCHIAISILHRIYASFSLPIVLKCASGSFSTQVYLYLHFSFLFFPPAPSCTSLFPAHLFPLPHLILLSLSRLNFIDAISVKGGESEF